MGVYIVQHKIYPLWIKVGHHKITQKRPNVYFRFVRRGFHSCICPPEIQDCCDFEHIQLLSFYPNLSTKDEKKIHSYLENIQHRLRCGEWFENCDLDLLSHFIFTHLNGILDMPSEQDLIYAKQKLKIKN